MVVNENNSVVGKLEYLQSYQFSNHFFSKISTKVLVFSKEKLYPSYIPISSFERYKNFYLKIIIYKSK